MGLIQSVIGACDGVVNKSQYRFTLLGDSLLYAEGVKRINSYSSAEVILSVKGGSIKITGRGLSIEKFCDGDVAVKGRVDSVERIVV